MAQTVNDGDGPFVRKVLIVFALAALAALAWTLSDLAGRERPSVQDVLEAIEWHQPLWQEA